FYVDEGLVDRQGRPCYELITGGMAPYGTEKTALAQALKEKGALIAMDVKPSTVGYLNRRGARLRIIAGWRNQNTSWVMGQPGIESLADLKGRMVGVKDFGSNRYDALAFRLREAGLDPKADVRYVRGISHGDLALRDGKVDAAFVSSDVAPDLYKEGFTKLLSLSVFWPHGRPDRIIVANEELLNERPDWAHAFVKAMIRAYWFIRTMPDNYPYLANMERRMRLASFDPDEHTIPLSFRSPLTCELQPFPMDGVASGFDGYIEEMIDLGEIDRDDAGVLADSLRLDVAREAFAELKGRVELALQAGRIRELAQRLGY
ncbi:MAG: ABC transporter substrate-binding protein, partial [Chloroflexota bacterium]